MELKTPLRDNEELPSKFMASCGDDSGYIIKLKYSFDKPHCDANLLKTDNWKHSVINCNFRLESPCASIGKDVQSINILIFDGSLEVAMTTGLENYIYLNICECVCPCVCNATLLTIYRSY